MPSLLNRIIRIAFRLYPFPNGAGAIVYHLFRNRPFREKTLEVKTTYGFSMTVFPNDLIGRIVYFAVSSNPALFVSYVPTAVGTRLFSTSVRILGRYLVLF